MQKNGFIIKQSWAWLGLLGVAVLALGVAFAVWGDGLVPDAPTGRADQQEYSRPIEQLYVVVDRGNVDVRSGQATGVVLERQFEWMGSKPFTSEEWQGDTLRIKGDCPDAQQNCALNYVIYLPTSTPVDVQVSTGDIAVADIAGNTKLTASSGNITVTAASGEVRAQTSDGQVVVGGSAKVVEAQTSTGNVDLTLTTPPNKVTAKVSTGNIRVSVPSGPAYNVQAHSSVGTVKVGVPQDSAAVHRIQAQTSTGDIIIE